MLGILTLGLTWRPGAASPRPRRRAVLTLAEALSRAEAASPLVRRARAERQAVAAREVGASLLLPSNPVVSAAPGRGAESNGVVRTGTEYFLHAEQTIEIGGQRAARRAVVSRALRTAELREQVARAETRARVRAAYVGAQLALRPGGGGDPAGGAGRRSCWTRSSARVAGGASSNVDLELARLERGSAARARVDATLAAADALARLRLLVGAAAGASRWRSTRRGCAAAPRQGDLPALLARARGAARGAGGAWSRRARRDRRRHRAAPARGDPEPDAVRRTSQRDLPGQLFVGGGRRRCRCRSGAASRASWRWRAPSARASQEELTLVERDVALEVERAFQARARAARDGAS